jgi:CarboxypepD_reg-like domain
MKKFYFFTIFTLSFSISAVAQHIRGQVTNVLTHQPVSKTTLVLEGTKYGTTSDSTGMFHLSNIPTGRYVLKASCVGYQTLKVGEVLANAGKETVLSLYLTEGETLNEVNIKATQNTPTDLMTGRTFTTEEVQRFAANFYDPARLAASFAGVGTANDQANHLVVRGNSPNLMQWRLEGVEIVNPNHLSNAGTFSDQPTQNGGGVNMLSTQLLSSSTLLTGNFPAEYANALSAVMDMRLRKGNNEHREHTAQASVLGIDLATEGAFSKKSKASYLVNYRYSFTGLLLAMGVKLGDEATAFQDLSINLSFPTKKMGNFTLFGMWGKSSNIFEPNKDATTWLYDKDGLYIKYTSDMKAIGGTHEIALSTKTFWRTSFAYSERNDVRDEMEYRTDFTPIGYNYNNYTNQKASLNSAITHQLNAQYSVKIGALTNNNRFQAPPPIWSSSSYWINAQTSLSQPYFQWNARFSNHLTAQIGVNSSSFKTFEPRLALQYTGNKGGGLSVFYSEQSMLPMPIISQTGYSFINLSTPILSKQTSIVFKQNLAHQIQFRAEAYLQNLSQVPITSKVSYLNAFEMAGQSQQWASAGTGTNKGIELSVEQWLAKKYYYLATVSLYDAKYTAADGVERDSRFNGKYIATITGGKEVNLSTKGKNRVLGLNIRLIYQGGYREMPINVAASALGQTTVFNEANGFTEQLPAYFRTDFRVSLKKHKPNYTRTFSLDLQNTTNQQNVAYHYYDHRQAQIITKYQLGIIPVLAYRVEF